MISCVRSLPGPSFDLSALSISNRRGILMCIEGGSKGEISQDRSWHSNRPGGSRGDGPDGGGSRCGSALNLGWKLFWRGPRCGSMYSEPGVLEKVLNQNLEGNGALYEEAHQELATAMISNMKQCAPKRKGKRCGAHLHTYIYMLASAPLCLHVSSKGLCHPQRTGTLTS
jgi:hypothetical protein